MLQSIRDKFYENKEILNSKDSEITELLEEILSDDACFLKINIDLALNILSFMGYSEEEAKDIYVKVVNETSSLINGNYKLI